MIQNALELFLKQKRFDLIYKYLYLKNQDNDFIIKAYLENIRAFNNFHEIEPSDGIAKDSATDFLNSFNHLYNSIKENGFDNTKKIPIGENGEISDGAHRLTCAAVLNLNITTYQDYRNDLYDYKFFINKKMNQDIMDFGALEYVKLNPNAYIVNLHSITDCSKDKNVENILERYGFIYYKKDIKLTFNGYVNLKKLSYGSFWNRENWIGNTENKFAGAQMHARNSIGDNPLRAYVFICEDINNVVKAKAEIRELFSIGNFSVHINDTREEAVWLAETYFNKNSLDMINSRPFAYEDLDFENKITELKNIAKAKCIDLNNICVSGSTPFDIYGIRRSSDLDFLYDGDKSFNIQTENISNHDSELSYYPLPKKEIIGNPINHFYYHGIKFITLDILYKMKKKRNEKPKDVNDCKRIKNFWLKQKLQKLNFRIVKRQKIGNIRKITLFGFIKITYKKRGK